MKAKILSRLNVIIASIIAFLGFSGCKAQRAIQSQQTNNKEQQTTIIEEQPVIEVIDPPVCLYGPPAMFRDTIKRDMPKPIEVDQNGNPVIMVKYGVAPTQDIE